MLATIYAEERGITPYGDYCGVCTHYGTCKELLPPTEALRALKKYYKDKGYSVGRVYQKGRFIEAEIYKDDKQVDKVLFDRKTGRLRSIY
jgi:hypothetical protein